MRNTYTDEQRIDALALLYHNRYNIALTSRQTGIPERTLREWRRLQRHDHCEPPMMNIIKAAEQAVRFENPGDALNHVYSVFLQELAQAADKLPQLLYGQSPLQQLQTMMKIIDRLELLKMLISDTPVEQIVRIEYVDPDGSVHANPYYQRLPSDDAA